MLVYGQRMPCVKILPKSEKMFRSQPEIYPAVICAPNRWQWGPEIQNNMMHSGKENKSWFLWTLR